MSTRTHLHIAGAVAVALAAASPLRGQPGTSAWSGSIEARGNARQVHYRIAAAADQKSFEVIDSDNRTTRAAIVDFSGISVRVRVTLREGDTECKLDAIPARGYVGACPLATGDTIKLTLVPPAQGMLIPDHEVYLARDAGPPRIARDATIFVLGPTGVAELVKGSNNFTCFVERPIANDFWPMCHNREAADNILPLERYRATLRIAGVSDAAITDSILAAFRAGRFHAPPSGALAYMLSRYAWTVDPESGKQIFLSPHLHIYAPNATNVQIGVDTTQRPIVPMRMEREGRPDASIVVGVKLIEPKPGP